MSCFVWVIWVQNKFYWTANLTGMQATSMRVDLTVLSPLVMIDLLLVAGRPPNYSMVNSCLRPLPLSSPQC